MEIIRQEDALKEAGASLSRILAEMNATPLLLLLSGGSSLGILDHCQLPQDATHLSIGVLDERFGEAHADQNIERVKAHPFFTNAVLHGAQPLFPPSAPYANPTELAHAFERVLHDWVANCPSGKIVVTMGVGEDGHVAGLVPPLAIDERWSGAWVIPHEVSSTVNRFTKRVTVTAHFLLTKVDHALVYMTGEEKRQALETLLSGKMHKEDFPAAVLGEMQHTQLFSDIL
jgi:6-phosphogluconolactonase/glucosamine-6-phosphate isomerase/deaminase